MNNEKKNNIEKKLEKGKKLLKDAFEGRKKVYKCLIFTIILLLVTLVFSLGCDIQYGKNSSNFCFLKLFLNFRPILKENIVAAFNILWSVCITVTIFILEFSEKYKYGVSLRRIIYCMLGSGGIFAGVFAFLLLFPAFYICMKFYLMQTGLWCLWALFIVFCETIAFFAWIYKGENIREILQHKTVTEIMGLKEVINPHKEIDGLAISAMLDHLDYSNVEETDGLMEMIRQMFQNHQFWKKLFENAMENVIITTWLDHIIHSCEWKSEYDRRQNVNTIRSLWKCIMDTIPKDDRQKNEKEMSVCMQFLQPFINANDRQNDCMLVRIWREFGTWRKQALVYMILYTAYRLYRSEADIYTWILHTEPELQNCMREIIDGNFWWDWNYAMRCWIDWSRYECREDINLALFLRFFNDMDRLRSGKWYEVKSSVLIQIIGGINEWKSL